MTDTEGNPVVHVEREPESRPAGRETPRVITVRGEEYEEYEVYQDDGPPTRILPIESVGLRVTPVESFG